MVVSLNSFAGFNSTANYINIPHTCIRASVVKAHNFKSVSKTHIFSSPTYARNRTPLLVAKGDGLATETSVEISEAEPIKKTPEPSNGSVTPSEPKQDPAVRETDAIPKRSKLTAREKLKAARVRSRDSEPKPVKKPELGSKVLEALRESDRVTGRKRSGLPEAPVNLLDDSKRGMPKKGLTFELPVGWDVFLIILSVVTISTIMFTTTYVVWKVGAIHFNEY
ncbi:uncharacterized protein [Rutidosis leptorrhynchoides]|uniref:uncharacterized protein n=1 Tax=Rutidosis leptorrhynchoides TaxID=125765 RepID=UPI003A99A018